MQLYKAAGYVAILGRAVFFHALMSGFVAVSWRLGLAVIYEKADGDVVVVTVICSTQFKDIVDRRKRTGRWM